MLSFKIIKSEPELDNLIHETLYDLRPRPDLQSYLLKNRLQYVYGRDIDVYLTPTELFYKSFLTYVQTVLLSS